MKGSDKAELKQKAGQALFSSHCFPTLQNAETLPDSGRNNVSNLFQPLYGTNHRDPALGPNGHETSPSVPTPLDPVMAARGMAFEAGYGTGSREARETVKKSLKPDLESFLAAVEDLTAFQSLVAETTAHRVVELAFVMAELVTGVPSSVDRQNLEGVKGELETEISTAYRMTLTFHPEDDQTLRQAFAYSQLQWPEHKAILTETDNDQSRNQIDAKMQDRCFENHAIGKLIPYLEKDAKPSTS